LSLNDLVAICRGAKSTQGGFRNDNCDIMISDFTSALKNILTMDEATLLFNAIDVDRSRDISENEIHAELAILNAALTFEELRTISENAGMKVDDVFNAVDADGNNQMDIDEFMKLLELLMPGKDYSEIGMLFSAVD
jgi:Ca2+-binding EF-hand superfamily protein